MKFKHNPTFLIIIGLFSSLTVIKVIFHPTDVYSIVSVLVGLTGILLFMKGYNKYDSFIFAWVFLQVPDIYHTASTGQMIPVMNAFPTSLIGLNIGAGMNLGLENQTGLALYINIIPMGLYFLLKYLNVDKPLGKKIAISRLKKGTFPQIKFPIKGIIEKVAGRNKTTAVYLVMLDNEIQVKDKKIRLRDA